MVVAGSAPMNSHGQVPAPNVGESPAAYADRVGRWCVAHASEPRRKELGQYLTPVKVAAFMAGLCGPPDSRRLRVLDPGAGAGVLSCALCEAHASRHGLKHIEIEAYEVDPSLAQCLVGSLSHARQWLHARGIVLDFVVLVEDFVTAQAGSLHGVPELFGEPRASSGQFDIAICNPPYFKLAKSDPRAQAAGKVVHGQPNIYALFMAVSASLLKPRGELVCITPRSYAAGPYFRRFRERFFATMRPEDVHIFESRQEAFSRDDVLQESVILHARHFTSQARERTPPLVTVSSSFGVSDLSHPHKRLVPLSEVVVTSARDVILRIPVRESDDAIARTVGSWSRRLRDYGLEVSTGPVVPFRSAAFLCRHGRVPAAHAPLLWMQNVGAMRVEWPCGRTGKSQFIAVTPASLPLLVPDGNYVLVRRFSAKEQERRLTAAPVLAGTMGSPWVGLENHLNYIHRPGGALTEEEAYGLAVLLNSRLLDAHFRTFNGNTQVSATELRAMPLPPLDTIAEMGRRARMAVDPRGIVDDLVEGTACVVSCHAPVSEVEHVQG